MQRRKITTALWFTVIGLITLVATWFLLNHFRVQFYDYAMESATSERSPYWAIIRAQAILEWPIWGLAFLSGFLVLIELARKVARIFRH